MNKKLITLAVAAAMVAPLAAAAETTLYGRIDTALTLADDDTDDAWDVATATTRIGVKGSEDLGNGLKAIFQAEWAFTSSEGGSYDTVTTEFTTGEGEDATDYKINSHNFRNRLAYAGLSGGFGTVAIGRQWTPYYGAVDKTDIFNNPSSVASANANYLGPFRHGDMLSYVSPNFSGFQGKLAVIADRSTGLGDSDGIDAYNPSLHYENGPINVGASYIGYDDDVGGQDQWGIAGAYNFGMFKVIAQYEDVDETEGTNDDDGGDAWTLAGEAYFGNNTVRALYGQVDADDNSGELDVWAIGFQHNFSKRTRVYAEYTANEYDLKGDSDVDKDMLSLGLRHDF